MRREYKIITASSSQNFFLSYYLLIKYYIHKKLSYKKVKKSSFDKEYKEYIEKNLKIKQDYFTHNIKNLNFFFNEHNLYNKNINALEIGSYEGNSAVFFLKYFNKLKLTCVDTFEGSDEHKKQNFNEILNNFNFNTQNFRDRVSVFKSSSKNFFRKINKSSYDLIYIDGSHYAKDVLEDAINSFNVLNKNGYIIFDDFLWDFYANQNDNPIGGIKTFIKKNFFKIKIISVGYQIIIKKL